MAIALVLVVLAAAAAFVVTRDDGSDERAERREQEERRAEREEREQDERELEEEQEEDEPDDQEVDRTTTTTTPPEPLDIEPESTTTTEAEDTAPEPTGELADVDDLAVEFTEGILNGDDLTDLAPTSVIDAAIVAIGPDREVGGVLIAIPSQDGGTDPDLPEGCFGLEGDKVRCVTFFIGATDEYGYANVDLAPAATVPGYTGSRALAVYAFARSDG